MKKNLENKKNFKLNNHEYNQKMFLQTLKTELFEEEVYVFTPKGELIILPKGALVVDFAYKISEEIGNNMIYSQVNNKNVPFIYELEDGDIVNIITTNEDNNKFSNSYFINFDLVNILKTAKAKNCILKNIYLKLNKEKENVNKDNKENIKNIKNIDDLDNLNMKDKNKKNIYFEICMQDKEGLALDMAQKIKQYGINIVSFNTNPISSEYVKINMEVEVENYNQIKSIDNLKAFFKDNNPI